MTNDTEPVRYRVYYYPHPIRFEEWVLLDDRGTVLDAGPLLKMYKGANMHDIRAKKQVVKVEVMADNEKPLVTLE